MKYSGVLLGPMMAVSLLVRVSLPTPWIVIGQELHRRRQRLLAAIGVMGVATIMACVIVWACYRFRFDSGPGGAQLDMTPILQMVADNRFFLHEHRWPEHDELRGWENSATVRVAMLFEKHHLLPQAWIGGFLDLRRGDRSAGVFDGENLRNRVLVLLPTGDALQNAGGDVARVGGRCDLGNNAPLFRV